MEYKQQIVHTTVKAYLCAADIDDDLFTPAQVCECIIKSPWTFSTLMGSWDVHVAPLVYDTLE